MQCSMTMSKFRQMIVLAVFILGIAVACVQTQVATPTIAGGAGLANAPGYSQSAPRTLNI